MKLFDKFNQTLGFTQTEGRVVVLLIVSFVIGLGIKVVKDTPQGSARFDYSLSDSEFAARSRLLDADTLANNDDVTTDARTQQSADGKNHPSRLIEINTATKSDLTALPGIGDAMAERIIRYRQEHKSFTSLDDLLHVKGIGKKSWNTSGHIAQ